MKYFKQVVLGILSLVGRLRGILFTLKEDLVLLKINNKGIFFGYYDVTPFNNDNTKILASVSSSSYFSSPKENEFIDVGYFELSNKEYKFTSIDKTNTWCWQQGCRLQWLPGDNNKIIFNRLVDGKYGSIIYDISSNEITKELHTPIYSVHPNGKSAISLNFSRLQRLRAGYGYNTIPDSSINDKEPHDDGVWELNLLNDTSTLLISLSDIVALKSEHNWSQEAEHYINHLCYCPSGEYFFFFHLWKDEKGRSNRVIVYSKNLAKYYVLDDDCVAASHYTFKNENELLLTLKNKAGKLVYRLYNISDNSKIDLNSEFLLKDSHPSFIDENTLLFDTYPDIFRINTLNALNLRTNEGKILFKGYHPIKFSGEFRCDLHPRLSPDKKMICIDTINNNNRLMKIIKL